MKKTILDGQNINLRARQTIYALAAVINPQNPSDEIVVNAEDLRRFITTSGDNQLDIFELINHFFVHLNQHPLILKSETSRDFVCLNWLSYLEIKEGKVHAQFTPRVADYFLKNQSESYGRLLDDLQPYKSKFTAAIVRLFDQYRLEDSGEIEFSFDYDLIALKEYFEVEEKYLRFFDFERFVLLTTQRELAENDILPYWFSFEKIKKGRNIKDIRFTVYLRPKVLLDLRPQLRATQSGAQRDIFDEERAGIFNTVQQEIFEKLTRQLNVGKAFAQKTLSNLTDEQARAYLRLLEFGVSKTTAYSFLKKYIINLHTEGHEESCVIEKINKTKERQEYRKGKNETLILEKVLRE